jgi:dienelactone hydrolase
VATPYRQYMNLKRLLVLSFVMQWFVVCTDAQVRSRIVVVRSGSLKLRAQLWRPIGSGPFPAILFSPGSGQSPSPERLGQLFSQHGYIFLALYRRGQGLSADQGAESGALVTRERALKGDEAANRLQLSLLEGEQLQETLNALDVLRAVPEVDSNRIVIAGHSFGGSLAMLVAERDPSIRAIVNFGGGAGSWNRSPILRDRLIAAARKLQTPVLYIQAANDYSTAAGEVLSSELQRLGKPHRLQTYRAFGKTAAEGHNILYLSIKTWQQDVFEFLDQFVRR